MLYNNHLSIKIKITTEGDHREPYVVEAEIGQDTIVAALDLLNAVFSTAMSSEDMRTHLNTNIYGWGVKLIEAIIARKMGVNMSKMESASMPIDVPPEIKRHILDTIQRHINKGQQKNPKFDPSKLFAQDKAEPDFLEKRKADELEKPRKDTEEKKD